MKFLMLIGAALIAFGIAGVIWGVVAMNEDRATLDLGDVNLVVTEGEFPPLGIAGAIVAGVGLVMVGVGAVAGRKR